MDNNAPVEISLAAKLFQFHENIRPPYWGTWQKTSKNVKPRNPFGQDVSFLINFLFLLTLYDMFSYSIFFNLCCLKYIFKKN